MIITEITYPSGNFCKMLEPEEGYKYITDGENYVQTLYLGAKCSIDRWYDTNDEPPDFEEIIGESEEQLVN